MVKSRTPAADISFVSCFRKAMKGMDSSCSSGYSSASIAVNTGCCSSSLQCPSRSVVAVWSRGARELNKAALPLKLPCGKRSVTSIPAICTP